MFMNGHRSQGDQKREAGEKKKGRERSSRALFLFLSVSSLSAFYSPYSNLQFTKPLGVFLKCYLPSQFFCSKAFRNFVIYRILYTTFESSHDLLSDYFPGTYLIMQCFVVNVSEIPNQFYFLQVHYATFINIYCP